MALPASTRESLRLMLGIKKSGETAVETTGGGISVLTTDGVTNKDLEVITREKLLAVLGATEGDFIELWKL